MKRVGRLVFSCFWLATAARAADRVAFIGVWERAQPMLTAAGQQGGIEVEYFKPAEILNDPVRRAVAESCRIVFILNIESADGAPLANWARGVAGRGLKVVALDKRGSHFELEKAQVLVTDAELTKYWRANGALNINRMFVYIQVHYFGRKGKIEPAVDVPDQGFYDPEQAEAFPTFAALKAFRAARSRWKANAPVAALLTQQSFWVTRDLAVIDSQIRALERYGINPVVIFGDRQKNLEALVRETKPDILIEDRHGVMWDDRKVLEDLDLPYLRPISMLGYTIEEWKKDPRGLSYRDVGMFMTVQESWGTIEPVVVGGMKVNISGFRLHVPLEDGIDRFAARTAAWLNLRRKANAEKKIAFIYYNKGLGKDDLMRGSPTGAFLDGPESLVRFLPQLKDRGFRVDRTPKDVPELISWAQKSGRLVGPWNQGDLAELVDTGDPVMIPVGRYRHWFETKLSAANRKAVIDRFGPPPGKIMTIQRDGVPYIVLPRVKLGPNLILAPQPERAEKQDEKLLHSRDVPPPHNYLAFYWWLQEEFKADAIVHWGTHGSLELMPGKEAGMSREDWSDICVGNMPNIDLWIMDNLGESTLARRRAYAQLTDHMVPPALSSPLPETYESLRRDIEKYKSLEPGLLREEYHKRITATAKAERLTETLNLPAEDSLSEKSMQAVAEHLHELYENKTPVSLHVLGEPPGEAAFYPYLTSIMGRRFLDHLAAVNPVAEADEGSRTRALRGAGATWLKTALADSNFHAATPELAKDLEFARKMADRLKSAPKEVEGLLRALEGRFLQPGPGPEPLHNPDSVPGGRNLYSLNPEEVPTRPAWEVGMKLVDQMLARKTPRKVGFDLNGMETMRDFGVLESQVLYLMGVRPVWDQNNLAIDVELIPKSELKRPRIDVFLAMGGMYKENFGTRVKLMDKAVRLVSQVEEEDNQVRQGTQELKKKLLARGYSAEQAEDLSNARIFGTKPGNMSGTHIVYLVPRSGVWDKSGEITDVYIDNMSYAYTGKLWGEKVSGLYEESIQGTDTLVRVWASNMTSQLSNHHAYEYLGGLSMAVKQLTGKQPEAFIADVRNPEGAKIRGFEEVLAANLRGELLNKEWLKGMQAHGYAGAGHAAELVKNTFGWTVTRENSVSQADWDDIYRVYVEDKYALGVREWMEKVNPHAMQEMAATMLEASRKGYWKASADTVASLSKIYAESVSKHGDSGGLVSGGNKRLEKFVTQTLNAAPGIPAGPVLAAKMSAAFRRAVQPSAAAMARARAALPAAVPVAAATGPPMITGQRLAKIAKTVAETHIPPVVTFGALFGAVSLLLAGFARRFGAIC